MDNNLPPATFHALREQNVREGRFLTIILSNNLLEKPLPLRCMFCGDHLNIATHTMPKAVIDTEYKVEDCGPLIDVRCGKCKVNWRIAY